MGQSKCTSKKAYILLNANAADVIIFTAIWLLLTDFDLSSLLVGIPSIGIALWCSNYLRSRNHGQWSITGLIRLAVYFIEQTLRGAWDLAARCCGTQLRVTPGLITYSRCFPHRSARTLFISCVNLLPGTLAVKATGEQLSVHVIDSTVDHASELERLGRLIDNAWVNDATGRTS